MSKEKKTISMFCKIHGNKKKVSKHVLKAESIWEQRKVQVCTYITDTKATDRSLGRYGPIIKEIQAWMPIFEVVAYVHELRSSDFEARNLAKHALSLSVGRHVWLITPYDTTLVPIHIFINQ